MTLDSLVRASNAELGLLGGNPKIASLFTLKKGSVNFQQLVNTKLGAALSGDPASRKLQTSALLGMLSFKESEIDLSSNGVGQDELEALKGILLTTERIAASSKQAVHFDLTSKSLGELTLKITGGKTKPEVEILAENSPVEETLVDELAAFFVKVNTTPVMFKSSDAPKNVSQLIGKEVPVLSTAQVVSLVQELLQVSAKEDGEVKNLHARFPIDIKGLGSVTVDLHNNKSDSVVHIKSDSKKSLEPLKSELSKSGILNVKDSQNPHVLQIIKPPKTDVLKAQSKSIQPQAMHMQTVTQPKRPVVSIESGFEIIREKVETLSHTPKNSAPRQQEVIHLNLEKIGEVSIKIESRERFSALKVEVDSPQSKKLFEEHAAVFKPNAGSLDISVQPAAQKLINKPEMSVMSVLSSRPKLTSARIVETIENFLVSTKDVPQKVLQSQVEFTLASETLGKIEVSASNNKPEPLQLAVNSESAKRILLERLGQKIGKVEVRVTNINTRKKSSGINGKFKFGPEMPASKAIKTINHIVETVSRTEKTIPTKVALQMKIKGLGEVSVEISKDVESSGVKIKTDSNPVLDLLAQHLSKQAKANPSISLLKDDSGLSIGHAKSDSRSTSTMKYIGPDQKRGLRIIEVADSEESLREPKASPLPKEVQSLMQALFGHVKSAKSKLPKSEPLKIRSVQETSYRSKDMKLKSKESSPLAEALNRQKEPVESLKEPVDKEFSDGRVKEGDMESLQIEPNKESLVNSDTQFNQPPLTLNNIPFNFVGAKLVGLSKVESSALPEMIQKILELGNSPLNSSGQKLEVQLEVGQMGNLLVDAVKHKDKINLQINVENAEVRRVLETQLRPMIEQMLKDGIEIGKLEVNVREQSSDSGNEAESGENERAFFTKENNRQPDDSSYAQPSRQSGFRERHFGYNSIEVLA